MPGVSCVLQDDRSLVFCLVGKIEGPGNRMDGFPTFDLCIGGGGDPQIERHPNRTGRRRTRDPSQSSDVHDAVRAAATRRQGGSVTFVQALRAQAKAGMG